ncbi:transcription factor IIIC, subunit 5, partial [Hygrophoropsis aurantiaca]
MDEPSSSKSSPSSEAPEKPLPSTPFYSVEYPGYVQPTSAHLAVRNLGGQSSIDNAFKRTAAKNEALLELHLRPGNPFAHPVPGDIVATNNIVVKIVKRKRKKPDGSANPGEEPIIGEYTAEAIGVIHKTARFRSMADYQYQPDMNDPLVDLRLAMDRMDVDAIRKYKIPEEKEDYVVQASNVSQEIDPTLAEQSGEASTTRSNLRLFPPPLFSRQGIPQNYNFKANPSSMTTSVINEETGEEKKRLINRGRWKGLGPVAISHSDATIPEYSPATALEVRSQMNQTILPRLQELFAERPIWTRTALYNQFSPTEAKEIHNSKGLLPLVCYLFQDGPWRDTLVRFKYDPRK